MDSREALVALNLVEGVGPVRARSLLEHFGDAPAILKASKHELMRVRNIGADTAENIAGWEKNVDLAGELKRIADYGCHVLISPDDDYPAMLREIYDPPLVLYVKVTLTPKDKNAVAMVGSRMTTNYGIESARKLAYQLAYVGVTVVSGGARGIDTAAHQGALSAKGRTVAVLGTGINPVAPPENAEIVARAHRRTWGGDHAVSPSTGRRIKAVFSHPQPASWRGMTLGTVWWRRIWTSGSLITVANFASRNTGGRCLPVPGRDRFAAQQGLP